MRLFLLLFSFLFSLSSVNAYFYANSFYHESAVVTSSNLYGSGYINGYYLGSASSPVNTPLHMGRMQFTPLLVSTGSKMWYSVNSERGYLGYCSLDSYSGATKGWSAFYCPTARLYDSLGSSPALLQTIWATWSIWPTWATWSIWPIWATGSFVDDSIIYSGSNIEISYDSPKCDFRQGICTIHTYTRFPVLANWAEIFSSSGITVLPTVSTPIGVDIPISYESWSVVCGWDFITVPADNYVSYLPYINANAYDVIIPFQIIGCSGYDFYNPPSETLTGTLSIADINISESSQLLLMQRFFVFSLLIFIPLFFILIFIFRR